ncbi:Putative defense protein 3, partial [Geodia barretti]
MMKMETFLLLLLLGGSARAFSSGAPSNACISLTPDHGGFPQPPPSPYTVDLSVFNMYGDGNNYYLPGQTYQLNLSSNDTMFRGFLLQARVMADDSTLTGSFSVPVSGTQLSACSPSSAGLTHTGNST